MSKEKFEFATNATTTIPNAPGCWANSETAVSTCCTLLGGVRLALNDSSIPACGYNAGERFTADTGSTTDSSSTTFRWSSCVTAHFNATQDGSVVLSTCADAQNDIATVTSTPSSTASATSGAEDLLVFRRGSGLGRGILAGIVAGAVLLQALSSAL